ncbi:MAG: 6-bladed beta-propeller, partial [Tannerella sp.]|nr:6-bladed beta-propeller [Tannerella sp.]
MTDKILDDYQLRDPWFGGEFVELDNAFYFAYYTKKITWHRFFLYSKSQNQVYTCNSHLYNPFFYAWHGAKARYKED